MADFATEVELSLVVPNSELRSARSSIESGLSDVSVGGGGAMSRATRTDGGGGGGRRERRMFRWARERTNLLDEAVTLLDSIEEAIGDGGGGGGGLLGTAGGFGLGRALGGVGLGAVGGLTGSLTISSLSLPAGGLSGMLGSVSLGAIVNPLTGSLAALLGGAISLGDLVDGEISDWNLPAKFGEALGKGFENAWPDAADTIETFFTENIFADLGRATRDALEGSDTTGQTGTQPIGTPQDPVTDTEQRMASRRRRGMMTITEAMDVSPQGRTHLEDRFQQRQESMTMNQGDVVVEQVGSRIAPQEVERIAEEVAQEKADELERRIARSSATGFGGP